MPSLETVASLLSHYGYALFLPLAIIEGPIVTIIGAFLASLGVFDIYVIYLLAVLGDVIGDMIYYWMGRAGRTSFIPQYGHYFGITEERIQQAEAHYDRHLAKTLIFGKITQAPILIIIVVAGIIKTDFWKFLGIVFLITLPKVLVFTLVGFYLGKSYPLIDHYLHAYTIIVWILLGLGAVFFFTYKRFKTPTT